MQETYRDGRPSAQGLRGPLLWYLLEWDTLLFAAASTMDLILTWRLLTRETELSRFAFVESNPIARYFLYGWGFDGLVFFKFTLVALIVLICQFIARRRISVARRLIRFATLLVMSVVVYSAVLAVLHT